MSLQNKVEVTRKYLINIRKKYSVMQECNIIHNKLKDPEAYAEYIAYKNQCLAEAKAERGV